MEGCRYPFDEVGVKQCAHQLQPMLHEMIAEGVSHEFRGASKRAAHGPGSLRSSAGAVGCSRGGAAGSCTPTAAGDGWGANRV